MCALEFFAYVIRVKSDGGGRFGDVLLFINRKLMILV
jgi:hypothetical protein